MYSVEALYSPDNQFSTSNAVGAYYSYIEEYELLVPDRAGLPEKYVTQRQQYLQEGASQLGFVTDLRGHWHTNLNTTIFTGLRYGRDMVTLQRNYETEMPTYSFSTFCMGTQIMF